MWCWQISNANHILFVRINSKMSLLSIQALGLSNSQAAGGQQSAGNLGMTGLNIGALPMNPALVAAALNQAGWGIIGNLQQGAAAGQSQGPQGEHPFPTPTSFSTPGGNVTTSSSGSAGILAGWGTAATAGPADGGVGPGGATPGGMPAATPPGTVTPQHHQTPGSWPATNQGKRVRELSPCLLNFTQ